MYKFLLLILALVSILFCGCTGDDPDELIEEEKPPVAFVGQPEERFVATWKTDNGMSVYKLKPDGTYELDSKIQVRGQDPIQSHLEGEWRVNGDKLLFKDGNGNVVPYAFKHEGDTLELSLTGSLKNKTLLKKQ